MNQARTSAQHRTGSDGSRSSINDEFDLMGKTIAGIVAAPIQNSGSLKIWMLRFTDGTHVEFVSPGSRRTLERLARQARTSGRGPGQKARKSSKSNAADSVMGESISHPQLALNVA